MKRALLPVVPLALLAACGGGDDGGLSKAEYLSKAEAICAKANADVKAIPLPTTPSAIPTYVTKLVTLAESVRDQMKALDAPDADEADLDKKVLDPIDAQIREGRAYQEQLAQAFASNDSAKVQQLVANPPTQTQADLTWMKSYGFKECVTVAETD